MPRMSSKRGSMSFLFTSMTGGVSLTTNYAGNASMGASRASGRLWLTAPLFIQKSKEKGGTHRMNFEFMTIGTPLPPCMPFPRALTGFPVSSTAKVMYCRMLDAMLSNGQGGRERNPVYLLPCHSHCRSPVPQPHDGQAFSE